MEIYDVLVVGGGPAGMIAAYKAGERGFKTAVLEKKARPGIKLSITGKGRCNLTNSADLKEFVSCFRNGKFLYNSFLAFSNGDTVSFFEKIGVPCVLERGGRYFTASGDAKDAADALARNTKKYAEIITNFEVKSVKKQNDGTFAVRGSERTLYSKNVILACGGASYPSTGSSGDGYEIAKSLGHKVTEIFPALAPVVLESPYLKELKGLKLKNVEISVIFLNKTIAKEFGEAEFTIFGADGPVILTLSGLIAENLQKGEIFISVNLKPALTLEQLDKRFLRELDAYGHSALKEMLKELLPLQMVKPFINYSGLQIDKKCSQINKEERERMVKSLRDFRFKVKGVKDIKEAIVTRGGVGTDEIDQKTMESKITKGLYFCGEVIDVDAPTGGFNLQAAFSTGWLAGNSIKNR